MEGITIEITTDRDVRPPTTITVISSTSDTREDGSSCDLWINEARKKVNKVRPKNQSDPVPCTIFRVPEHIRRCHERAYEPLIVPIGPYHHDPSQNSVVQEHKWRCVRYLLSRHRSSERASQLLDDCLSKLKALDAEIRCRYYEDFPKLNAHKMAELMLLDGCFIIHLLLKREKRDETEKIMKRRDVVIEIGEEQREEEQASGLGSGVVRKVQSDRKNNRKEFEQTALVLESGEGEEEIEGLFVAGLFTIELVLYDLLKLENQIPFFVIEKLFNILKTPGDPQGRYLPECALQLFQHIHPHISESFQTSSMDEIHHLLHLFQSSRITSKESAQENISWPIGATPEWIPRATELAMAGVKFRKKEGADSFLDITFKDGTLEIPPLHIYDYTGSLLQNLIAFEQCYMDTSTNVTIYAIFMDCIIDEAKDARLLHLKDILVNRVGTDEAVADLFNQLCNQIYFVPDWRKDGLPNLSAEVNKYYGSNIHKWRASLKRDYFSNPWTVISVIAAVLLLILTIEQAVFSGLSYLRPPKGFKDAVRLFLCPNAK